MSPGPDPAGIVGDYLDLGLALGRHVEGFVDAYYGPPALARRIEAEPVRSPERLVAESRGLLAALDRGDPLDGEVVPADVDDATRRRWIRAQVLGLLTSARKLAGEPIGYAEEVAACYGVDPVPVPEDDLAAAHRRLAEALPGSGELRDRYIAFRESQAVPPDLLRPALDSLAEDFRERTATAFGLPDGERIEFELVTDKPWSGFNTYLGDLHSEVAINTDLPVLSNTLAHLVAHEAYPGHHTEHSRKEAGLVRRLRRLEETIFLVGTPQCLLAEGLADLGLEVVAGRRPEALVAGHLHPLGIPYEADVLAELAEAAEGLGAVRGNAAWLLHAEGADPETVVAYLARWSLLPPARAEKAVEFLLHPTWRAYISCYVEGLPLVRRFVDGDPARFARLLTEQLVPADLEAAA